VWLWLWESSGKCDMNKSPPTMAWAAQSAAEGPGREGTRAAMSPPACARAAKAGRPGEAAATGGPGPGAPRAASSASAAPAPPFPSAPLPPPTPSTLPPARNPRPSLSPPAPPSPGGGGGGGGRGGGAAAEGYALRLRVGSVEEESALDQSSWASRESSASRRSFLPSRPPALVAAVPLV
jgi:hypothetical protein